MGLGRVVSRIRANVLALFFRNFNIDNNVQVEGRIEIMRGGKIQIGSNTVIRRWVCLKPWGGTIHIGDNCTVNSFCHISGNGGVIIGNNVLIATQCVLISANHNIDRCDIPINEQGETAKPIVIEDDVWLGAGVKVLAGVTIHRGSVIGAGSVVTKDVPEYSIAVGVPATVIKLRKFVQNR